MHSSNHNSASSNGHSHEPNLITPRGDGSFHIAVRAIKVPVSLALLTMLPQCTIHNAHIRSTGHPASGPFRFDGVRLLHLLQWVERIGIALDGLRVAEVEGADGFGTRMALHLLVSEAEIQPTMLATHCNNKPLTRAQGLVRLIVPAEKDEALRQIKWIARIALH